MKILTSVAVFLTLLSTHSHSATLSLGLGANDGGRFYEYASDAYVELGLGANGNPTVNSFYSISRLPRRAQLSRDIDVLPNDGNFFDAVSLQYDDASISGVGVEVVSAVSMTTNFNQHVPGEHAVFATAYTENVNSVNGSITFTDGVLSSIDLTADLIFAWNSVPGGGVLSFVGQLIFNGDAFSLLVGDNENSVIGNLDYVWEFDGHVTAITAVPVPAGLVLFLSGGMLMAAFVRRRGSSEG